jgi:hypothetical protein
MNNQGYGGGGGYPNSGYGGGAPPGGGYPGGGGGAPPGGGGYGGAPMTGTLEVGDVLQTTFRTIGGALVPILGCALAVVIPTVVATFVIRVAMYFLVREMMSGGDQAAAMAGLAMIPLYLVMILVLLATNAVGQGGIMYAVAETLSGRSASLGQAFRVGLSRAIWVFLTSLVVGLAVGVGTMACVIPGIIAFLFFAVAAPVCIVEKLGPIDSIQRSIQLTEGQRLTIFLVFLVVIVGWFVIAMCILAPVQMAVMGGAAYMGGGGPDALQAMQNPFSLPQILMEIVNIPVQLVATMGFTTLIAVIYARLRGLRDGVDAQALASVFS